MIRFVYQNKTYLFNKSSLFPVVFAPKSFNLFFNSRIFGISRTLTNYKNVYYKNKYFGITTLTDEYIKTYNPTRGIGNVDQFLFLQ